ncbi:MAG: DUF5799 family protein, partial [Salinibacter sp.]
SQFSNQQWGLIMTATDLKIEHPEDDERAKLLQLDREEGISVDMLEGEDSGDAGDSSNAA